MKFILKKFLQATGFDAYAHGFLANIINSRQHLLCLRQIDADLVLDIGANRGQFAQSLIDAGYTGKIVSFEPLSSAHCQLVKASSNYADWVAHDRCAIGNFKGFIDINIAGNSMSSSVLPMSDAHISAAEDSVYVDRERVPINTLDSVGLQYANSNSNIFLKIDTQGFEWQVLDGAVKVLPLVKGVLCELSLVELYKDQKLWLDIINRLEMSGFTLWSLHQGFADSQTSKTLQVDATFLRI